MIWALTFGAVVGMGLWLIVLAIVPSRDSLATVIARLHRTAQLTAGDVHGLGGRLVARFGPDRFVHTAQRRADLAVLDRPVEVYAAQLATAAIIGAAVPVIAVAVAAALGIGVGLIVPVWAVAIGATVAVALVVVNVKEQAEAERTALRHQLGAYLDVLAMLLTAAEADEQALSLAAHAGDGRLFRGLQRSYRDAAIAGRPLLTGMRRLGDQWGLIELTEIADAGSLAASDGAAVRRTLTAKARAMRATQLSAEETDARLRTNKLGLPQILLAVGFLVLIMYPAFAGLLDNINP
jgi:Flp pilus assembly protein TadB